MVTFLSFLRAHTVLSSFLFLVLISLAAMGMTGTLSYPYIMLDRQIQSVRHCTFGEPMFDAPTYGFRFVVSRELCILPHRIFPDDGSIQVVPKGFYFVIGEYASGSVVNAAKGTFLFERTADNRSVPVVMEALQLGGFLKEASTTSVTTSHGVTFTVVRHATGLDPTQYFSWAFTENRAGDILLSVLSHETKDFSDASFDALLEGVEYLP